MRRGLVIVVALAALAAIVAVLVPAASGGSSSAGTFKVVLDNAFGLTKGADLKSDGVRVGIITDLDVQPGTARAIVTAEVQDTVFAGFRKDVFCAIEPQSLIGEYFMNCSPGKSSERLKDGATVPVDRTAGTIPADLVQDILRRPERERVGLLLAELGGGFAGRGDDVQAAIRRAVPALRETERVLELLNDNRSTLLQLTRNADVVLDRLADNRRDVGRFATEARQAAQASADRHDALEDTIDRLPEFLRQLRPTLRDLGTTARLQAPALADLRASAGSLTTLFQRLGPFSDSARPAVRGLGRASVTGRQAVREARSTVNRLRTLGRSSIEPLRNARFVLEDVNDPNRSVEPNRLAPVPQKGFTGLEALLQYFFVQSQAINIFDSRGYALKLEILINECSQYTNAKTARENPERTKRCSQALGPNQPNINVDITDTDTGARSRSGGGSGSSDDPAPAAGGQQQSPSAPSARNPLEAPKDIIDRLLPKPPKIDPKVPDKLELPDLPTLPPPPSVRDLLPGKPRLGPRSSADLAASDRSLLDFLLGP